MPKSSARIAGWTATWLILAAAAPQPDDFTAAAEYAAALFAAPSTPAGREPAIVTGRNQQQVAHAEYRRVRADCQLNRLIRIQGRSEIGVEWRCGPLDGRWNDVYAIAEGRVVRIDANVPFLNTSPVAEPERR
ncbi:MAG: hypothetical protein ACXWUN_02635 [Allosphingosinicella sp.]